MGVFDKLERGLERAVKSPFARVFKAEVQPVEIASAMRGAMDDRAAVLGPGRTMVPNVFTIELADTDHERLSSYENALTDELVAAAEDYADAQRYVAPGPFEVRLVAGDDLETGIFRVRPAARDGRSGAARPDPGPRRDERGPREVPGPRRDDRRDERDARPAPADPARGDRGTDDGPDLAAYRRPGTSPDQRAGGDRGDGWAPVAREGSTRGVPQMPSAPGRRRAPGRGPLLEIDGRQVPLTTAVTTIGRDETSTIKVDDAGASRRHAEIRISHDGPHLQVILRDLGSTNGTYLNGEQVGTEELRSGDRITLGRTHLVFRVEP